MSKGAGGQHLQLQGPTPQETIVIWSWRSTTFPQDRSSCQVSVVRHYHIVNTDKSLTSSLDSHAHILEYGASRLIPLEAAKNIKGLQLTHGLLVSELTRLQRLSLLSDNTFFLTLKHIAIRPSLWKAGVGTILLGQRRNGLLQSVLHLFPP
jgi:hypothetical protein